MEIRDTIKCHYEKNTVDVIWRNDNGPVTVISNVHADLPLTIVKRFDSSSRNHIKIDRPHCITKYNKYMGGIDVRGKICYWPHYIITVDELKSATFTVFKLVNADAKRVFLVFTCQVTKHYLKAAKVRRQLPLSIIYPRKSSWKRNTAGLEDEKNQENHFVEKCFQKRCRVCPNQPRTWSLICKVGLCMELCFKAFHMS